MIGSVIVADKKRHLSKEFTETRKAVSLNRVETVSDLCSNMFDRRGHSI